MADLILPNSENQRKHLQNAVRGLMAQSGRFAMTNTAMCGSRLAVNR